MPRLTNDEITSHLARLPAWRYENGALVRELTVPGGFVDAVAFVNRLTEIAEQADHHPDLRISWNRVTVMLTTHSAGGVTERDVSMAAGVDALADQAGSGDPPG